MLAKHTAKAPVVPISGSFTCDTCNGHTGFDGNETFNMLFIGDGNGNETITTQVNFGGTNYDSVIGVQNNITINVDYNRGDIESGDGAGNNEGFIINANQELNISVINAAASRP